MTKLERMRKRRHMLLTKPGSLNQGEVLWLEHIEKFLKLLSEVGSEKL